VAASAGENTASQLASNGVKRNAAINEKGRNIIS